MPTYILTGDIRHAGRVQVTADTPDDAIAMVAAGDFLIVDEAHKQLAFDHNGEDPEEVDGNTVL